MSQHTRIARRIGIAFVGTAVAVALAACSAGPAKPATTPKPVETGLATGGTPTATPSGIPVDDGDVSAAAGYTAVFDSTHHVGVAVPDSWTDVNGDGFVDGDGNNWIAVTAAPDLEKYANSWGYPGVEVAATPFPVTPSAADADAATETLLTSLTGIYDYDGQGCTATKTDEAYSDQVYVGHFSTWQDCKGSGTSVLLLTAYDTALSHEVFVNAALVSDDDKGATLDSIIDSFQASFDSKAIAPRG